MANGNLKAVTSAVLFKVGNLAAYKAILEKDANTLYFIEDMGMLFKGDKQYGSPYAVVDEFPADPAQGILYILKTTGETKYWNGSAWNVLVKSYTQTIGDVPSDDKVPTEKAVADYVTKKIQDVVAGDGTFVTEVTVNDGTSLTVHKGAETEDVTLTGFANNPTYDEETRTITIPVAGKSPLTIALGKDLVVTGGKYVEDSNEIWLTIAEGGAYPEPDDNHEIIKIPVAGLVDTYTGKNTNTANTTVLNNEVSVDVKVSTKAGNALKTEVGEGEEGLYVPTVDISGKLDKVTGEKADEIITANADGTVKVSGKKVGGATLTTNDENTVATEAAVKASSDAAIAAASSDATSKANAAKSEAISTAANDATSKADAAKQAAIEAAAADAQQKANAAQEAAISTAASDAQSKADNALTQAKAYADTKAEEATLAWDTF